MTTVAGSADKQAAASGQHERECWAVETGTTRNELKEVWIQQVSSEAFGRGLVFVLLPPPRIGVLRSGRVTVRFVHNKRDETNCVGEGVSMIWFMDPLAFIFLDL